MMRGMHVNTGGCNARTLLWQRSHVNVFLHCDLIVQSTLFNNITVDHNVVKECKGCSKVVVNLIGVVDNVLIAVSGLCHESRSAHSR